MVDSKENLIWELRVNLLDSNIGMHILHTVLYTFAQVPTMRIFY